jgi:hypothetical protein
MANANIKKGLKRLVVQKSAVGFRMQRKQTYYLYSCGSQGFSMNKEEK